MECVHNLALGCTYTMCDTSVEQDEIDFDLVFHPGLVEDDTAIKCHQNKDYGRRVHFAKSVKVELN